MYQFEIMAQAIQADRLREAHERRLGRLATDAARPGKRTAAIRARLRNLRS